ncbi:transcription factor IIIB 90 kDa subunit-like isoform X2 [Lineus longissimus]|uniref:transcription factor IIIB 90 kDa subunit-like isoform X2 n=1 Tax=Lineus longissimus TaxID=88925 RepID=UPI00315DC032
MSSAKGTSKVCTHCGSSDIDTDSARGDAVCTNCGSVLEDQIIVSEIQFQENSIGGTSVIGQYVSSEGNKSHSFGPGFHHGFGKESRALTLQNGKKKIQHVGGQLKLNQHCIDTAYNFFKMAVSRRLTRGRRTTHVVAACLYLVCRTEGTPHMLLDFSDVLQTNVYNLGRTYLQLSRELCINVPVLDPCLYIQRFAHRLEFGDKTHEVSMTALRLVQRMKRDWIHAGRRPSGLCGAALLVAARWHDFNRTLRDIIKVAKVCESTIRKRLTEFEETPSSQLTIDEFQRIDLEEEHDPPSFTAGKKKAKLAQFDDGKLGEVNSEITEMQAEIERALESNRLKKPKDSDSASVCSSTISSLDLETELTESFIEKEIMEDVLLSTESDIHERTSEPIAGTSSRQGYECKSANPNSPKNTVDTDVSQSPKVEFDIEVDKFELDSALMPPPWDGAPSGIQGPRPTAASLGLKESIEECLKVPESVDDEEDGGELDLTDIDDQEIDQLYLLNPEEIEVKTSIWTMANADYLKEQKEKEEKEAHDKEMGITKPEKKKKKTRKKQQIQANTAGEAIEKILQEKKISSKINYDVLKDLNRVSELKKDTETVSKVEVVPVEEDGPVPPKPSFERRFKRKSVSIDTKPFLDGMSIKQPKLDDKKDDIVIESGPIEYASVKDDGEIEEEDYEEEDEHMSAAQLMGHGGVDEYVEAYEEDDY